jgi:hypothetical protein
MLKVNGKKKELAEFCDSDSSMPLRHIESIVIWEGNYAPDILNIGYKGL